MNNIEKLGLWLAGWMLLFPSERDWDKAFKMASKFMDKNKFNSAQRILVWQTAFQNNMVEANNARI